MEKLTYAFIWRLEPAILRRTRSHTHLFLLHGTSFQLKMVAHWKQIKPWTFHGAPAEVAVWIWVLHHCVFSFAQKPNKGWPWTESLPRHGLKPPSLHLPITLPRRTCRLVSRASLLLTCPWPQSDKLHRQKGPISLLMTITTVPALELPASSLNSELLGLFFLLTAQ